MKSVFHPSLDPLVAVLRALEVAAQELIREANKRADKRKTRPGRGATLRPGPDTPLWNAVIAMVKPHLRRHGDRALLARELGVHRARVGEFFDRQSTMPDAERTLVLLLWLSRRIDPATAGKRRT
jgi:hypothetical protein